MVHSLNKGKRAERELCKILIKVTGVEWKRVPCSGALFTTHGSEEFAGDVYSTVSPYDHITIECKHHKESIHFSEFFNDLSRMHKWLKQSYKESRGNACYLFFKDRGKWFWVQVHGRFNLSPQFLIDLKRYSLRNPLLPLCGMLKGWRLK